MSELPYEKLLGRRVWFVQGSAARIDPDAGAVILAGSRIPRGPALRFDRLIYTAGSADDFVSVPGIAEHADRGADRASARRLRETLVGSPPVKDAKLCLQVLTQTSSTEATRRPPAA